MGATIVLVALRGEALAGGAPPIQLLFPLLTTLAAGHSLVQMQLGGGADGAGGFRDQARAALGFLPAGLRIPDLYIVDVAERDAARFAAPIDQTTYLSFNLLPRGLSDDRSLSVLYATEGVPAMRHTSALVGLRFSVDF